MATSYPGAVDTLTNPTATDTLDSATVPHAEQHANANDAIEAIEGTLGINPQGSSATVTARLSTLDTTVAAKANSTNPSFAGTVNTGINTLGVAHIAANGALSSSAITDSDIVSTGLNMSSINSGAIADWQPNTSYVKGDLVNYLGVAYRRISAGTSTTSFTTSNWNQVTPASYKMIDVQFQPSTGLDTIPRFLASGGRQLSSGNVEMQIFTPNSNTTISNISTMCSVAGTDVLGTTVRRMGLYTVNLTTNAVTLVARTLSDSTLWNTVSTTYTKALDGTGGYPTSYTLLAGNTYAIACLAYNTGGTFNAPSVVAGPAVNALLSALSPAICGRISGQSDLPTTGTLVQSTTNGPYARLS